MWLRKIYHLLILEFYELSLRAEQIALLFSREKERKLCIIKICKCLDISSWHDGYLKEIQRLNFHTFNEINLSICKYHRKYYAKLINLIKLKVYFCENILRWQSKDSQCKKKMITHIFPQQKSCHVTKCRK